MYVPATSEGIRSALLESPDINLATVENIQALLQKAGVPVSRNWLLAELSKRGRTTSRPRLNRALDFFFGLGLAVEGSKGIQWTHSNSPSLQRARATGRRL
jgi:hypothetical protein